VLALRPSVHAPLFPGHLDPVDHRVGDDESAQRYWHDRILELREQIALMDEAPLGKP